ncbi:IDEAL domain-containing protein [Bacillaceae bacterium Marseille-Q3522]|nr:IDEAL domain-containing protein [Bacillaceae bacterium Marseille-Q3522]
MNNDTQLKIADWVKGKTANGELIHGYIEAIDTLNKSAKVYVVECDHVSTVGKSIETLMKWLTKMPASSFGEQQTKSIIDLALSTKDKEWFMELTSAFIKKKQETTSHHDKCLADARDKTVKH